MINIIKLVSITSISSFLLIFSMNAQATIFKWTDANGQTHYTAQPPVEEKLRIKAKDIEDKIKSNAGKYRAPNQASGSSSAEKVASSEDKSEERLAGPNPQLVKYCDNQRNNLKQLKKNFRNVWIDVKGIKTTLNQEQRKEKVAMLQSKVETDCSGVQASKKS